MEILEALENEPEQPNDLGACDLLGFDTETTGLNVGEDSIISASLVLRRRKTEEDKAFNFLINPNMDISPEASKVNGFDAEFVKAHGKDQKREIGKIAKAVLLAQEKRIPLVAYNASFDVGMLKGDLKKIGMEDLSYKLSGILVLDPLIIDRELSRRPGKRTLSSAMEWWGVQPKGNYHDAQTDTRAALDLLCAILKECPEISADPMGWERDAFKKWAVGFNAWRKEKGLGSIREEWGL